MVRPAASACNAAARTATPWRRKDAAVARGLVGAGRHAAPRSETPRPRRQVLVRAARGESLADQLEGLVDGSVPGFEECGCG
jgi:hypothetical protein